MGILDRLAKILNPPPSQKPSTPLPQVDQQKKFQIKIKGMTPKEFEKWVFTDPEARRLYQNSPTKRDALLNAFQAYFPQGFYSIKDLTIRQMKQKVERDIMFGETLEIQKRARELKPLLDLFEKKFLK